MNPKMTWVGCLYRACLRLAELGAIAQPLAPWSAFATQIFYGDNNLAQIHQIELPGGTPQLLANTQRALLGLAVDQGGGKIYWTDNGLSHDSSARGRVYRSNLDGSGQEILYTAALPRGSESAGQLQFDLSARHVYWIDEEGDHIRRMSFDGTGTTIVASVPNAGTALELDSANQHLYFTTGSFGAGTAKIERMDLDGSNRMVIANVYGYSLALDVAHQQIYAADWFGQRLMRVAFDGTGLLEIAKFTANRDVQVFNGHLFYANVRSESPDNTGPYFFQWVRAGLDGSNRTVLYEVPRAQGPSDMIQFAVVPEPSLFVMAVPFLPVTIWRHRRSR